MSLEQLTRLNEELERRKSALLQDVDTIAREEPKRMTRNEVEAELNALLTTNLPPSPPKPSSAKPRPQESKETTEARAKIERITMRLARLPNATPQERQAAEQLARMQGPEHEIAVLRESVKALTAKEAALEKALETAQAQIETSKQREALLETELDNAKKQTRACGLKMGKVETQLVEAKQRLAQMEQENQTLRNEQQKLSKMSENNSKMVDTKDKILQRVEGEALRYKQELNQLKTQLKEHAYKQQETDTASQAKRQALERQNNELVQLVKKQEQLINVLRREKLHLEMLARVGIGEAEFKRILELGIE